MNVGAPADRRDRPNGRPESPAGYEGKRQQGRGNPNSAGPGAAPAAAAPAERGGRPAYPIDWFTGLIENVRPAVGRVRLTSHSPVVAVRVGQPRSRTGGPGCPTGVT